MPEYRVLLVAEVKMELVVEAQSYEEAASKAAVAGEGVPQAPLSPVNHSAKVAYVRQGTLKPTWVGAESCLKEQGEFEYPVEGHCSWCRAYFVSRDIEGEPWKYALDPTIKHGDLVCYDCLKKGGYIGPDGHSLLRTWDK